jgi:monoamine oxidase
MTANDFDIVVVGAGLAGLALAGALLAHTKRVVFLEARDRVGGRILSLPDDSKGARYDMGPAWIWPHNRRARDLAAQHDLTLIPQHASGRLVFEDGHGAIRRDLDFATMGGALRLKGGLAGLTEALATGLPGNTLRLGTSVDQLRLTGSGVAVRARNAEETLALQARCVILAAPPRLIADRIGFEPELPARALADLRAVPTWMAGHAKVVATYPRAFWREAGLSGDAISHLGPLMEMHDASPDEHAATGGALFGFVAPGHPKRAEGREVLKREAVSQMARLFGPAAADPRDVYLVDWAEDAWTSVPADRTPPTSHPAYRALPPFPAPWRDRVLLAGSEVAPEDVGFLEGALAAAEAALTHLGLG